MTTEVDNYLEHYGVKGMRWGKRSARDDSSSSGKSGSSEGKSRREVRAQVKAERKAVKEDHKKQWDKDVLDARDRLGKEGENLSEARKQYKIDKKVVGRKEAKKVFKEHEDKFIETYNIASLNTTKEQHQQMIATVGLVALSAVAAGAQSAYRDSW